MTLNETPTSNRVHIGIFGKANSGKSTFMNALTGQQVSITADIAGTTTDLVYKPMEIYPLGPCVIIDTAGFNDKGPLGKSRIEKTKLAAEKSDIAVILISAEEIYEGRDFKETIVEELEWYQFFKERNTPVLFVINKSDLSRRAEDFKRKTEEITGEKTVIVSSATRKGMEEFKKTLCQIYSSSENRTITGNLVSEEDTVLLVMPQDIQAPKGRLILPQVQTIRELLDKKCIVVSVTTDKFEMALQSLKQSPKLIITDSQVFDFVYKHKPEDSMLTSFSVLFAALKGDMDYYLQGAKKIDTLTKDSRVLIAECCTHAPLNEDIGREKIPKMLRKRVGEELIIDIVSGVDFPEDLSDYDLIIQCGACMFNRKYVMSRIARAKEQKIPMTNYGVVIAHMAGILEKIQTK